jgi:tRNA(His) 5'-end guanylyltransferase
MKAYEDAYRTHLSPRMPIMIRVDGRAFHTLLKNAIKPFDLDVMFAMNRVLTELAEHCQGTILGYTQSDEASLVLQNDKELTTQQWFRGNLQKIASVAASIATRTFNEYFHKIQTLRNATFDARVWIMPWEDVPNYFIWRQHDYMRNAISMAARVVFSHKECVNKNSNDLISMLLEKGIKFNDYSNREKFGYFVSGSERLPELGQVDYETLNTIIQHLRTGVEQNES